MYPHFVELHDGEDRQNLICVNIDNIVDFHVDENGMTILEVVEGSYYVVAETYDEVKDLIRSAGCAIRKADPRLDTSMPLSWDELTEMSIIGEPVWNSNKREWMLLIDSSGLNDWVDLLDNCGKTVRFGPHDAQMFPLYRMKKQQSAVRSQQAEER